MKKAIIPLVASVFMGLLAAALAHHMIKGGGPTRDRAMSVKIVAAKTQLPPGHALTSDDLMLTAIAAAAAPPNTSTDPAHFVGRVIVAPLLAGQPVLDSQLAPPGTPDGLQSLVPDGMRAITLDASESNGMLGLLMPGSRVDVVTTSTGTNSAEPALSRILAQDVCVLAVGQRLTGSPRDPEGQTAASRTITLLVTPHDAAALDLAQTMARVRLILRGTSDRGEIDDDPVLLTDLRGGVVVATSAVQQNVATTATQPAPTPTGSVVATTQPADRAQPEAPRRIVTLILGDKEQRVSFREQPKAGNSQLSDTKDPNDSRDSERSGDPFANP
jgi:pilus assembly protein CpaB